MSMPPRHPSRRPRRTRDEHILLERDRAHAKQGIIGMFADEVDSAGCARDVSGGVSEARAVVSRELVVSVSERPH